MADEQKIRQSIERRIEEWHNSDVPFSLCEHLGWSPKDYKEWIEENKIPQGEWANIWSRRTLS